MLLCFAHCAVAADDPLLELTKRSDDHDRLLVDSTGKELAVTVPDAWQGNVSILSPNGKRCGVAWPHFLMNREGKWLSDDVEPEGQGLVEFEILRRTGSVVAYRGKWRFRNP